MSLPEIARRRVKPIIHSFCYNRQTGDLVLPSRGRGACLSLRLQEEGCQLKLSDPSNTQADKQRLKI